MGKGSKPDADTLRGFRQQLRQARAAVQAQAEAYTGILETVEKLGKYLQVCADEAPAPGLCGVKKRLREDLFKCPGTGEDCAKWREVEGLYERLVRTRNVSVHEGAMSRTAGQHATTLALALEERLMALDGKQRQVGAWMVRTPHVAELWHTVSEVRNTLATHGYTALPLKAPDGRWRLVLDAHVAQYVWRNGKEAPHRTLKEALQNGWPMNPAPEAQTLDAATLVEEALDTDALKEGRLLLVTEQRAGETRVVGVLTAHDLLV